MISHGIPYLFSPPARRRLRRLAAARGFERFEAEPVVIDAETSAVARDGLMRSLKMSRRFTHVLALFLHLFINIYKYIYIHII
jgi:hypothetical protein